MLSNSIYGITTFGESHSKAIGVVIQDIKPGIDFPLEKIKQALEQRRPGKTRFTSSRNEPDDIEILSGVFEGKTTGMPVCLVVYNKDQRSEDYDALKDIFRPEHAELAYFKKYKIYDYRGGGRASGRETIARVAAAALYEDILAGIDISVYPITLYNIRARSFDKHFLENNPYRWPCPQTYQQVIKLFERTAQEKDSFGGIVEVKIAGIPAGLGDPVFEKLDANLAKAILSIGGVKGIEFGLGFQLARMKGSQANQPVDSLDAQGKETNAGGIWGGITTGEPVIFRFSVKPTPSIGKLQQSVNSKGERCDIRIDGRFDTCIVTRILPVAEAMIKLTLADAVSYQKLITGEDTKLSGYREIIDKLDEDILIALSKRKQAAVMIAELKKSSGMPAYQPQREKALLEELSKKADSLGVSQELIRQIWQLIFEDNRGKT